VAAWHEDLNRSNSQSPFRYFLLYVVLIQPYCMLIYNRLKNKIFLSICKRNIVHLVTWRTGKAVISAWIIGVTSPYVWTTACNTSEVSFNQPAISMATNILSHSLIRASWPKKINLSKFARLQKWFIDQIYFDKRKIKNFAMFRWRQFPIDQWIWYYIPIDKIFS